MSSPTTAEGDKRGLDVIRRDVMSSEPTEDDKRNTFDESGTDDDDGCVDQDEGDGAAGPKPVQVGTRNKKLRRDGEARNLSQQQREECQSVMVSIQQIEEMEYKEQVTATEVGAWSSGRRAGLGMEMGKWVRNVAFATHAILGGARRQKRDRSVREVRSSKTRGRKRPNTSRKGAGAGGDTVKKGGAKVPAQPSKKQVQVMWRIWFLMERMDFAKENCLPLYQYRFIILSVSSHSLTLSLSLSLSLSRSHKT
jgi:hypothetical protein